MRRDTKGRAESAPVLATPAATPLSDDDLAKRTLRTVAVLVAACVVFVGLLSITAVVVTSRAVGGGDTAAAAAKAPDSTGNAKKPLSI